jgi:hypothetical protein
MNRRTLRDDLVWGLAVFVGFIIGALIFGAEPAVLIGAAVGITIVITVRAVRRR